MILTTITYIGFILWFIAGYSVGRLIKKQNDLLKKIEEIINEEK